MKFLTVLFSVTNQWISNDERCFRDMSHSGFVYTLNKKRLPKIIFSNVLRYKETVIFVSSN